MRVVNSEHSDMKVTKDRQGGFVPSTVQIVCGFGVQNVMKRQADIMGVDGKAVREIWKQKEDHKTRLQNLEEIHKELPVIRRMKNPNPCWLDPSPRTRYVSTTLTAGPTKNDLKS